MAEILYGIHQPDGRIISISDILALPNPETMRGSKCQCICPHPNCGRPLDAKLGYGKKEPHFAHQKGHNGICDIAYANETALHMMAKEIIAEEGKFACPSVEIGWKDIDVNAIPLDVLDEIPIYRPKTGGVFECTNVELEKRIADIVPDIVVSASTRTCLIEIFVTHRVPPEKRALISQLCLPTIEIDLSDFKEKEVSREELRNVLLTPNERMNWIYSKDQENDFLKAQTYYQNHPKVLHYIKAEKQREEEKRRRQADEEKKRKQQLQRDKLQEEKRHFLLQPQNYASELKRLRDDSALQRTYQDRIHEFRFYRDHREMPFFIDIPITGEMVFQCDRRIWQGIIFNRYIYKRRNDRAKIPVNRIFGALKEDHKIPINWDLAKPYGSAVIKKYMGYLEKLGFVITESYRHNWLTVRAKATISPPNAIAANELQNILRKIDLYSPDVDILIEDESRKYNDYSSAEKNAITRQREYACGKAEVENQDFNQQRPIKDQFGRRWLLCTHCNQICREDEMASYQYAKGRCRDCDKKRIMQ